MLRSLLTALLLISLSTLSVPAQQTKRNPESHPLRLLQSRLNHRKMRPAASNAKIASAWKKRFS
jgi:hypothetical protein